MRDGTRRLARHGPAVHDGLAWTPDPTDPEVAWSDVLTFALRDVLPQPGEPSIPDEGLLVAEIAVAALRAAREGRLAGEGELERRTVFVRGAWVVLGGPGVDTTPTADLVPLLHRLDPTDPFGLEALVAAGTPVDPEKFLITSFAARLAGERHALARRHRADRRHDALRELRVLALRLERAAAPPPHAGPEAASDGRVVTAPGGATIWDGHTLDPRGARAAARALVGEDAPPIRRWLVAMSRLRVDRELLARREPTPDRS